MMQKDAKTKKGGYNNEHSSESKKNTGRAYGYTAFVRCDNQHIFPTGF